MDDNGNDEENRCIKSLRYDKSRFMEDFEPKNSERERRKRCKLIDYSKETVPPSIYDEKGAHLNSGNDICDCLIKTCPGCHFPCKKCKSSKCGHECRSQRNWIYQEVRCQSINSLDFVYIRKHNSN